MGEWIWKMEDSNIGKSKESQGGSPTVPLGNLKWRTELAPDPLIFLFWFLCTLPPLLSFTVLLPKARTQGSFYKLSSLGENWSMYFCPQLRREVSLGACKISSLVSSPSMGSDWSCLSWNSPEICPLLPCFSFPNFLWDHFLNINNSGRSPHPTVSFWATQPKTGPKSPLDIWMWMD